MLAIRNTYGRISKIACFLFALHVFNLSVDSKDNQSASTPEDLSVNDIESFAELITETVLGLADTFEEHDEHSETSDGSILDINKVFYAGQIGYGIFHPTQGVRIRYFICNSDNFITPAYEISAPPPKG